MSAAARRTGLTLFLVYLIAYGAFVGVNAFWPEVMRREVWAGVNLAVTSGMALIVGAFALAVLYAVRCGRPRSEELSQNGRD
ncbi:MAG: DUF485 domain-containing protein [Planctomyces sp.]|nr:DUF485 domain-containing protein [Planctomyces sp.]